MILRDLIRQPVPVVIATATGATHATLERDLVRSVATVAGVAVATSLPPVGSGIPPDWCAGLNVLRDTSAPIEMGEVRWRELVGDALRLAADWGERAHVLGWTVFDLFGCSPGFARRLDRDGVAMLLRGRRVTVLDQHSATICNRSGPPNVFHRHEKPGAIVIWEAREWLE